MFGNITVKAFWKSVGADLPKFMTQSRVLVYRETESEWF